MTSLISVRYGNVVSFVCLFFKTLYELTSQVWIVEQALQQTSRHSVRDSSLRSQHSLPMLRPLAGLYRSDTMEFQPEHKPTPRAPPCFPLSLIVFKAVSEMRASDPKSDVTHRMQTLWNTVSRPRSQGGERLLLLTA